MRNGTALAVLVMVVSALASAALVPVAKRLAGRLGVLDPPGPRKIHAAPMPRLGGVAVFPADTVYGLACDTQSREAVERLYLLKRRRPDKPAAVMFFDVDLALEALPELGAPTREAVRALLPGAVTLLLPNPAGRFPLAGGEALGLRVPDGPLRGVRWPVEAG